MEVKNKNVIHPEVGFGKPFSLEPEDVQKEIEECPYTAKNGRIVVMPYRPEHKLKNNEGLDIVMMSADGLPKVDGAGKKSTEPSSSHLPLGWVLSVGKEVQDLEPGMLIVFAGHIQRSSVNGKEYYFMYGNTDAVTEVDLKKIKKWF